MYSLSPANKTHTTILEKVVFTAANVYLIYISCWIWTIFLQLYCNFIAIGEKCHIKMSNFNVNFFFFRRSSFGILWIKFNWFAALKYLGRSVHISFKSYYETLKMFIGFADFSVMIWSILILWRWTGLLTSLWPLDGSLTCNWYWLAHPSSVSIALQKRLSSATGARCSPAPIINN